MALALPDTIEFGHDNGPHPGLRIDHEERRTFVRTRICASRYADPCALIAEDVNGSDPHLPGHGGTCAFRQTNPDLACPDLGMDRNIDIGNAPGSDLLRRRFEQSQIDLENARAVLVGESGNLQVSDGVDPNIPISYITVDRPGGGPETRQEQNRRQDETDDDEPACTPEQRPL